MADRPQRSRPPDSPAPIPTDNPPSAELPEFLVVGAVVRPHGIRGELLVEAASETFRSLRAGGELLLGDDPKPHRVASLRAHRGRYLLKVDGVEDRDAADAWRGAQLRIALADSEPLPEGVYYRWQVLGAEVVDQAGAALGKLEDILETGANDVYLVRNRDGRELLLPAIESVVLQVDLEAGQITVAVPEGLDFSA